MKNTVDRGGVAQRPGADRRRLRAGALCRGGGTGPGRATLPMYDPGWPKPMPGKWKIGGVTGLAVAPNDDTVWVYDRPNDLTESRGSSPRPGVGLLLASAVDDSYRQGRHRDQVLRRAARARHGHRQQRGSRISARTPVRKCDTKTGKLVGAIAHTPELENGGKFGPQEIPARTPGVGGAGPGRGLPPRSRAGSDAAAAATRKCRGAGGVRAAFRRCTRPRHR